MKSHQKLVPSKHLTARESLLGLAGLVRNLCSFPNRVEALWEEIQEKLGEEAQFFSFDEFVYALSILYAIREIDKEGSNIFLRKNEVS